MHFTTAIQSSTGGRSKNEDHADHFAQDGLAGWVLADGLGGHRGGGLAASLATDAMMEASTKRGTVASKTIEAAARAAQDTIHERQRKHPEYSRMRTTFVLLLVDREKGRALWGHAGDSRLYHFRDGRVVHRTTDHSVVQALIDAGEIDPDDRRNHDASHRILRALGDSDAANPDVADARVAVQSGDAFLLCSDGFWEAIPEDEMLETQPRAASPEDWLDTLTAPIEAAAEADQDNYTAVAVFVDEG